MKDWMIAADGSAVNLAQVRRVTAEQRSTGSTWYVWAQFAGVAAGVTLTADLASREAAVTWIAERFDPDRAALATFARRFGGETP